MPLQNCEEPLASLQGKPSPLHPYRVRRRRHYGRSTLANQHAGLLRQEISHGHVGASVVIDRFPSRETRAPTKAASTCPCHRRHQGGTLVEGKVRGDVQAWTDAKG